MKLAHLLLPFLVIFGVTQTGYAKDVFNCSTFAEDYGAHSPPKWEDRRIWLNHELGVDLSQESDEFLAQLRREIQKCGDTFEYASNHPYVPDSASPSFHLGQLANRMQLGAANDVGIIIGEREFQRQKAQYLAAIKDLPACDSRLAIDGLIESVANSPAEKEGIKLIQVSDAQDISETLLSDENAAYSIPSGKPIRHCSATGFFNTGKTDFQYHLEWMDKTKGQYWIQIDQ